MPSVGDRVVFEGIKVGGGRREGELLEISGRSVRVRWPDGSESFMFPGPGAMSVIGRTGGVATSKASSRTKAAAPVKRAKPARAKNVAKKQAKRR